MALALSLFLLPPSSFQIYSLSLSLSPCQYLWRSNFIFPPASSLALACSLLWRSSANVRARYLNLPSSRDIVNTSLQSKISAFLLSRVIKESINNNPVPLLSCLSALSKWFLSELHQHHLWFHHIRRSDKSRAREIAFSPWRYYFHSLRCLLMPSTPKIAKMNYVPKCKMLFIPIWAVMPKINRESSTMWGQDSCCSRGN